MIDLTKYELKPIYKDNVIDHFGLVPKAKPAKSVDIEPKQPAKMWENSENSLQKCELEARINTLEYAKISPKFKIEEKIEQLRLELKKYE